MERGTDIFRRAETVLVCTVPVKSVETPCELNAFSFNLMAIDAAIFTK